MPIQPEMVQLELPQMPIQPVWRRCRGMLVLVPEIRGTQPEMQTQMRDMQPAMQMQMQSEVQMQPDSVMQTQMQLPQMQPVMQMQMQSEVQPVMQTMMPEMQPDSMQTQMQLPQSELLQDQPAPLHQMSFTTSTATNALCLSAG